MVMSLQVLNTPGCGSLVVLRSFSKGKRGQPEQSVPLLVGRASSLSSSHMSSATHVPLLAWQGIVEISELRRREALACASALCPYWVAPTVLQ